MKYLIPLLMFMAACSSEPVGQVIPVATDSLKQDTVVILKPDSVVHDSVALNKRDLHLWGLDFDTIQAKFVVYRMKKIKTGTITLDSFICLASEPRIQMKLIKVSGSTLFVSIPNSTYLTQSIGTTGALSFTALATYDLTEWDGIDYVDFDFNEGDHLSPGRYSRKDFKECEKGCDL